MKVLEHTCRHTHKHNSDHKHVYIYLGQTGVLVDVLALVDSRRQLL